MTFDNLLDIAGAEYPDILDCWDPDTQCDRDEDALAFFVKRELQNTYDKDETNVTQLHRALTAIEDAVCDLNGIGHALEAAMLDYAEDGE